MKTLPKVREDLKDFEKVAAISVDVLVRRKGQTSLRIGRYLHGLEKWQVDWCNGYVQVAEWWDLPEVGTGTKT